LLRPRFRPVRWIKSRPNFSKKRSPKYILLPRLPRRRSLSLHCRRPLPSRPNLLKRFSLPPRPNPPRCLSPRRRQRLRRPRSRCRRRSWPSQSCRWPRLKFQSRPGLPLRRRCRHHPSSGRRSGLCNCRKSRPRVRKPRDHPLVARRLPAKQNLPDEAMSAEVPASQRLRPRLLCPGKDRRPGQAPGLPGPRPRLPSHRKKYFPQLRAS
jgi:hypothetical protein